MRIVGVVLSAFGIVFIISAFAYDTAPEGTHNMGLMQNQMMWLQLGILSTLIGTLFLISGYVVKRLEDAGVIPPSGYVHSEDSVTEGDK